MAQPDEACYHHRADPEARFHVRHHARQPSTGTRGSRRDRRRDQARRGVRADQLVHLELLAWAGRRTTSVLETSSLQRWTKSSAPLWPSQKSLLFTTYLHDTPIICSFPRLRICQRTHQPMIEAWIFYKPPDRAGGIDWDLWIKRNGTFSGGNPSYGSRSSLLRSWLLRECRVPLSTLTYTGLPDCQGKARRGPAHSCTPAPNPHAPDRDTRHSAHFHSPALSQAGLRTPFR